MEDDGASTEDLAYIRCHPPWHLRVSDHVSLKQHFVYLSVVNCKPPFCGREVQIPAHKVSICLSDDWVVVEKDMRELENSAEIPDSGNTIGE